MQWCLDCLSSSVGSRGLQRTHHGRVRLQSLFLGCVLQRCPAGHHLDTIDQLLGYLTWRDSKTAIVCFVDRKDFSAVLKQIEEKTKEHLCFIRYLGSKDETWLDFEFHLPGDEGRSVSVAILAFHVPREL